MTKPLKKSSKATLKESSKKVIQAFECKYCGTKFHKESTLSTHMCVKKRRHMEIESPASRFGFRAFQRFYDLTTTSKKPKTTQEFIDSPYYIDFVKFGNHLANLKPIYPDKFIDSVVLGGIKLKDWTNDIVYYMYVDDLIKKEPATAAIERTIAEIVDWSTANNTEFNEFFSQISANEAAHLIQAGKISPWALYLCETGGNLMDRFTADHSRIIGGIIEPSYWMRKFKKEADEVEFIRSILDQSGL
jgi:hypothetical protein